MPKIPQLPNLTSPASADEFPIEDTSASTTKRLSLTNLKSWLQTLTGWISTAMLADGAVTGDKTDGIWWEELGRTKLSTASKKISVSSLPDKKYLRLIGITNPSGLIDHQIRFNNDSGSNYNYTGSDSGGTEANSVNQNIMKIGFLATSRNGFLTADIFNYNNQRKSIIAHMGYDGSSAPARSEYYGSWATGDSVTVINRIDLVTTSSGNFAAGSELIVLGHD